MDAAAVGSVRGRIGERWVVRHRLADGSATDLTGWLDAVSGEALRLRTRAGADVVVARESIIAARRVTVAYGGRDPLRASAEELERVAARAWVADWELLGEWTLRSGGGFTARANSCLAVGDPGVPEDVAAAQVVAYANRHGIRPRVQVIEDAAQEQALRGLGWTESYVRTAVLVVRLSSWLGEEGPDPAVEVSEQWTAEWERAYSRSRPTTADPAVVRQILTSSPPRAFAGLREDGRLVAIGRGQVSHDWLGIASVWTDPEYRRRGRATHVMRGLGHWSARLGARSAYLQVAAENEPAIQAYERLGFRPHHCYLYLSPPT